jgi:hypothetical protein
LFISVSVNGQLVEVADPADDRREVDDVRAALRRLGRHADVAQVALDDLAGLAHPARRVALVADADLPVRGRRRGA